MPCQLSEHPQADYPRHVCMQQKLTHAKRKKDEGRNIY